ncbi:MAG: NAD-dependent epimerase/dehydratase family protein [Spirochaetota bacterium]
MSKFIQKDYIMKTALITGATGFMGASLCKSLHERGYEIRVLVFPGESLTHIQQFITEVREGDITQPETLKGIGDAIDVVYHLAARVVDHGTREQFYHPIVEGTRNILNACAGSAGRFVYISSICACGIGRHMKGITETSPCIKTGIYYGDAKLEAEKIVNSFKGRFPNGWVIVRPANVTGPRSVWVNEVGEMFQKSIVTLFDRGKYSASLIYIDNLIDGLILAGERTEAAHQTYFFRDDWQVTWKQYLTDLSAMLGKRPRFSMPFGLAWSLGALSETVSRLLGIRPMVTRHAVGLMGRNNDVDTSKAQTQLGWNTRITYQEAMKNIQQWVKKSML